MGATARAKLEAIRLADLAQLNALSVRDRELARQLSEREGLRRQLMERIGATWNLPPKEARGMTVTALSQRLDTDSADMVICAAAALRNAVADAKRLCQMTGRVAETLIHHLRWVWAAVKPVEQRGAAYEASGAVKSGSAGQLLETWG